MRITLRRVSCALRCVEASYSISAIVPDRGSFVGLVARFAPVSLLPLSLPSHSPLGVSFGRVPFAYALSFVVMLHLAGKQFVARQHRMWLKR